MMITTTKITDARIANTAVPHTWPGRSIIKGARAAVHTNEKNAELK